MRYFFIMVLNIETNEKKNGFGCKILPNFWLIGKRAKNELDCLPLPKSFIFVDYLHRQLKTQIPNSQDRNKRQYIKRTCIFSISCICHRCVLSLNLCDCVCSYMQLSYAAEYACAHEYNSTYTCVCVH